MICRLLNLPFLFGALLLCVPASKAGVVVDLIPETTEITLTGSTQTFDITVQLSADQDTQSLRGYQIPIDLSPPLGDNPPVGWTVTGVTQLFTFDVSDFFASSLDPAEGDVEGQGLTLSTNPDDAAVLTTTPVSLFSFTVELGADAVEGEYTASVVDGLLVSFIDGMGEDITVGPDSFNSASISLVPEPSSGLAALVVCLSAFTRRRRVAA